MGDEVTEPRILTAAEIDEIERRVPDGYVHIGMDINDKRRFGEYLQVQLARVDFENQRRDDARNLIATIRHERERADEAERIVDDLVQLYAPQIGERCPWCELYPRSHGDWWEPYQHADDCAYIGAREYLAQRPKDVARP